MGKEKHHLLIQKCLRFPAQILRLTLSLAFTSYSHFLKFSGWCLGGVCETWGCWVWLPDPPWLTGFCGSPLKRESTWQKEGPGGREACGHCAELEAVEHAFFPWRETLTEAVKDESCSSCRDHKRIGMIRKNYPNLSPEIEVVKTGKWKARKDWSPEEFSRIRKTAVEGNKAGGDGAASSEGLEVALGGPTSTSTPGPWRTEGMDRKHLAFSFRLALESFGLQLTAAFGSFSDAIFRLLSEAQIWALVHSCRWGSGLTSFKCHTAKSASLGEAGRCAAMICGCHFCAQSPGCSLPGDHSSSTVHPGMAVLYSSPRFMRGPKSP